MTHKITVANSDQDIAATFSVVRQLRPHLNEHNYVALVRRLQRQYHYQLIFLTCDQQVCAVSGFRIAESLVSGKHVYVEDLVTDESQRSSGFGHALLEWIAEYAKQFDCHELHLDSGVQRHAAHRFYLRERFDIVYYHFKKTIR